MRPSAVVPFDPPHDVSAGILETFKAMLPDAFLFQAPKEPLDHAVLFRRVRRYELLLQVVVPARRPEAAALEYQAVVTSNRGCWACWSKCAEPCNARFFQRSFSFAGTTAECTLVPDQFTIMALQDSSQMSPAVSSAVDVGDIHRPANVAGRSNAPASCSSWSWCSHALGDEPSVRLDNPVNRFLVYRYAGSPQHRPDAPVPERRILPDQFLDPLLQLLVPALRLGSFLLHPLHIRPCYLKHHADPADRGTR